MSDKPEKVWLLDSDIKSKVNPVSVMYQKPRNVIYRVEYIRADLAKPSEWISVVGRCLKQAESMIGSPTEDDLQKFINWMRAEYPLPSPPAKSP